MNRRSFLKQLASIPALAVLCPRLSGAEQAVVSHLALPFHRVHPSDPSWPPAAAWEKLRNDVGGHRHLVQVESPLAVCVSAPNSGDRVTMFSRTLRFYLIGDNAGALQTSGWVDAWTSTPSASAVAARSTADVVAGVNFACESTLRLVVKGGGHSYQGTSNAPDSLLNGPGR